MNSYGLKRVRDAAEAAETDGRAIKRYSQALACAIAALEAAEAREAELRARVAELEGDPRDVVGDTGHPEADRLLGRLASADPDFCDIHAAAILIRKLVVEHKGPDGFATWKDAAVHERMRRKELEARVPKWVPVTERLPEAEVFVLTAYHPVYNPGSVLDYLVAFHDGASWYDDEGFSMRTPELWMEIIPAAPKEEA